MAEFEEAVDNWGDHSSDVEAALVASTLREAGQLLQLQTARSAEAGMEGDLRIWGSKLESLMLKNTPTPTR